MPYERGDVAPVLFPDSNLCTAKRRPALVVLADDLNTGLPQTVVVIFTGNLARSGHPSRIAVDAGSPQGKAMGLLMDSVVMTDNIATILDNEIDRVIGRLDDMSQVNAGLRHTLGLID